MDNVYEPLDDFSNFLLELKHWDKYVVDQFVAGEYCNRLKGRHTKEFVLNTDKVISNLKELLFASNLKQMII